MKKKIKLNEKQMTTLYSVLSEYCFSLSKSIKNKELDHYEKIGREIMLNELTDIMEQIEKKW